MKTKREIEMEEALKKATDLADRVEEATRTVPDVERTALIRSTSSMATNMAMALDVLRRQRSAAHDGSA